MIDQVVVSREKLVAVADAIRAKTETTEALTLDEMSKAIEDIKGGNPYEEAFLLGQTKTYRNDTVTSITSQAFYYSRGIAAIDFPKVTSVGASAFSYCTNLTEANLPEVTSLGGSVFYQSTKLTALYAPKLESIGTNAFRYCPLSAEMRFTHLKQLATYAFQGCTAMELVDINVAPSISTCAFYGCTKLEALILRRTGNITTLANTTNTLTNTKIASGEGFIYVPKSLIDTYKTATNWSTYADQFRAIEDYPEITGG